MSFHFAYPNVIPKKELFIGCGRYTVFQAGGAPCGKGYEEVIGAPNTPNNTTLKRAVQLLAPESFDSPKAIYHKQDRKDETYQGDSLDLAWFLAHIFRSRQLRCRFSTDAWCTGVIQINGSPHLLDVDPTGFTLKLQAFLAPENSDRLFIVPLANVTPEAHKLCAQHEVDIIRLGSRKTSKLYTKKGKTVLAVPADGLPGLLSFLFCRYGSATKPRKRKSWLVVLFLLLLGAALFANRDELMARLRNAVVLHDGPVPNWLQQLGLVSPPPPPLPSPEPDAADIEAYLEQGKFNAVPDLLQDTFWSRNEELGQLRQKLLQPFKVQGIFDYIREDNLRKAYGFPAPDKPPTLTHHDFYKLHISADQVQDSAYLYIFQVDSGGSLTAIFPSKQFGTGNPLRPWQWPVNIPAGQDKWIFLDRLPKGVPSPSREIIYLLATPWPARDIETLSEKLLSNPDDEAVKAKILARLVSRRGKFPAVCCFKWSFLHGR